MKLTKDYIFRHIKETKFPLWSLYVVQNYKRVPLMHYNGDDFSDGDDITVKIEKSLQRLSSVLSDFPAEAVLSIDLKNSKTANGSGILGPVEFYNVDKEINQPQNFNGFSGFVNPPQGWVSESVLNGKLEELRVENTKQINDLLFKQREKDFEEKVRRERQELAELRKELNDEKKKYESNTGAAAETLVFAVKKILAELFPGFMPGTAKPQQLGEVAVSSQLTEQQTDAKYKAVEKLANFLYDNDKITEAQIDNLTKSISANLAAKQGEEDVKNE